MKFSTAEGKLENLKKKLELKQYTPEQPMGQRKKSQEKLENILGQIKIK